VVLDTSSHLRCSWKATRTDGEWLIGDWLNGDWLFSIHFLTCAAVEKPLELTGDWLIGNG
ncbi:hypothetical protein, partial [Salinimicrobium terrae]|uniref:hypothetical protein n=1 Tax=Salinimicrobium terrae TaxID=470866 RepID=UPI00146D2B81